MLSESQIEEVKNGIMSYRVFNYSNKKYDEIALLIGINNPLYRFINMLIKMNKVNFKK